MAVCKVCNWPTDVCSNEPGSHPCDFRVTIVCRCTADFAEGFGTTVEDAQRHAYAFFHKDHGKKAKPREVIVERWNRTHWESV